MLCAVASRLCSWLAFAGTAQTLRAAARMQGLQSLPAEARRVFAEAFKVNAAEMATFNGAHAAPNSVQQAPKRGYVARRCEHLPLSCLCQAAQLWSSHLCAWAELLSLA